MKLTTASAIAETTVDVLTQGPHGIVLLRDRRIHPRAVAAVTVAVASGIEAERAKIRDLVMKVFHASDEGSDVYKILEDWIGTDPYLSVASNLDKYTFPPPVAKDKNHE